MTPYGRLCDRFTRLATLGEAQAVLHWDAAAMMPSGGAQARGEQLAVLAGLAHAMLCDADTGTDLAAAASAPSQDTWHHRNLELMQRAYRRATAIPVTLIEAQTRANAACETVWREARAKSDFALVRPRLAEVVALCHETASALGEALGVAPYDALLDGFQPGLTSTGIDAVFTGLAAFLGDALPRAEALQDSRPAPLPLTGPFPEDRQEEFCRWIAARIGLDFDHARLDQSTHPFCGGTPSDVRITTRYRTDDVASALLGVLHETGHALYERGLPTALARQKVAEAGGMAAHESQSLLIEMQACRSDAFLGWLGPQLHRVYGGDAAPYQGDNLTSLWRRVRRGCIRVDADELTYPLHIMLRFRLERALIAGDLLVADLPGAWRDSMRDLIGITPPDDAQGCLQDTHWYDGAFGYFPCYTLGAIAAAQLMQAARREMPELDRAFAQGEMGGLLSWLRREMHGRGSLFGFDALLQQATGKTLDPGDFIAHLTTRYLS